MTRGVKDYSKCLIIQIVCKDPKMKKYYIDFCTGLPSKMVLLKKQCSDEKHKKYNLKMNKEIRENGGYDNYEIIILEEYTECTNSNDAKKRVRYWIDKLENESKKSDSDEK